MDQETRKLLEEAWTMPVFEAIFTRRSRRFGLGMEIKHGPNAFKSEEDPIPLSLEERRRLTDEVTVDFLGYGPIQQFLLDDSVTELEDRYIKRTTTQVEHSHDLVFLAVETVGQWLLL